MTPSVLILQATTAFDNQAGQCNFPAGWQGLQELAAPENAVLQNTAVLVSQNFQSANLPLCLELFHDLQEGVIDMLVIGKPILDLPQI